MFCIHKTISSSLVISKINIIFMKHNLIPRMLIYHKLLGGYDLVDKYKKTKIRTFCNVRKIIPYIILNKCTENNLNMLLFKEFLTQKKIFLRTLPKKNLTAFETFVLSSRKKYFYLYLEIMTQSLFLLNCTLLGNNSDYSIKIKMLNYSNSFFSHLNCSFKLPKTSSNFNFGFIRDEKIGIFKNYFFIPNLGE